MKPILADAVIAVYPNAVSVWVNDEITAHDADGNSLDIDLSAVTAKLSDLQAQYDAQQQTQAQHKQNAIDKLTALGLTADEISALGR